MVSLPGCVSRETQFAVDTVGCGIRKPKAQLVIFRLYIRGKAHRVCESCVFELSESETVRSLISIVKAEAKSVSN